MKQRTKRKGRGSWLFLILILLGLGILTYPMMSNFYYTIQANNQVERFQEEEQKIEEGERDERVNLAKAYNAALAIAGGQKLSDPYTDEERKRGVAAYARMLEVKEQIGYVVIPKINVKLPIYTGTNERVLQKGIGHMEGTSLPIGGESTHAVLTGHRGLPSAKLFTNLDELKKGDKFYIKTIAGICAYEVFRIKTVEPSDFSQIAIEDGVDLASLLTCTPYMINSHRLIVTGRRVPYNGELDDQQGVGGFSWIWLIAGIIVIALIVAVMIYRRRKKQRGTHA